MQPLHEVAPAFIHMAHTIVWCATATVDANNRPWSRILHPLWTWDGQALVGFIAVTPTRIKREHLAHSAHVSCTYLAPDHDTAIAECEAELLFDENTRVAVWNLFEDAPAPVGYDPRLYADWESPTSPHFAVMRLVPWRLRVQPGEFMLSTGARGRILTWSRGVYDAPGVTMPAS